LHRVCTCIARTFVFKFNPVEGTGGVDPSHSRIGEIGPQVFKCGAQPKITSSHREKLAQFLEHDPDLTLEELREGLSLDCTVQAIHYVLEDMGISYKKRHFEQANKTEKMSL
ncbi:MAG: hypothetical protein AAGC74_05910, partial [Verrucomicrobiota bacterium]